MTIYIGNKKIQDTNAYGIYSGENPIKCVYYGSNLVYTAIFNHNADYSAQDNFQTWIVPTGITSVTVDMAGAKGYGSTGGGGRVQCTLATTPGQTLYIWAGIIPTANNNSTYNASDIRTNNNGKLDTTSLQSRLITAGGAGSQRGGSGGAAGYPNGNSGGNNGKGTGGGGASQTGGGGAGGGTIFPTSGASGKFGLGGQSTGGAGGAGWYGGGSGGSGSYGDTQYGGGGGGSSYCNPDYCTDIVYTGGYNSGAGYVKISWME